MNDSISRQAAIDALNEYFVRIGKLKRGGLTEGEKAISLDTVGVIKTLHSAQRWIPVTDRLPEEDGDYLVTFEQGYRDDYGLNPIGIAPFEVDCEGFGIWQENFHPVSLGSLGSEWVDIRVTAWQPLPKTWEGEQNGV